MTRETHNTFKRCFISLGSNLDSPIEQVTRAITELQALAHCRWQGVSSLYQTEPVGPAGQDDYINAVACLDTLLAPEHLLDSLQAIENKHKRVRSERWGARTLDLDILLIDDLKIMSDRLTLPHPELTSRNFVLIPLAELASGLTINNVSIADLLAQCPAGDIKKI